MSWAREGQASTASSASVVDWLPGCHHSISVCSKHCWVLQPCLGRDCSSHIHDLHEPRYQSGPGWGRPAVSLVSRYQVELGDVFSANDCTCVKMTGRLRGGRLTPRCWCRKGQGFLLCERSSRRSMGCCHWTMAGRCRCPQMSQKVQGHRRPKEWGSLNSQTRSGQRLGQCRVQGRVLALKSDHHRKRSPALFDFNSNRTPPAFLCSPPALRGSLAGDLSDTAYKYLSGYAASTIQYQHPICIHSVGQPKLCQLLLWLPSSLESKRQLASNGS